MTSRQKLWVIASWIAAFCLSFAILRERHAQRDSEPRPELSERNPVPSEDAIRSPPLLPPSIEHHEESKHPVTVAPIESASGSQATLKPMPVNLDIVHNRRMKRIEAFVSNLSDTSLSIEVGIVSSNTANNSTFVIDLGPQASKTFGTDEGMALAEGDRIDLRSAEYEAQSQAVR